VRGVEELTVTVTFGGEDGGETAEA
jgi:hypothetical protein